MMQLFKEVMSPENADKANTEKQKDGVMEDHSETPVSASESIPKKGKHGDPGVCCGGCS
ncbi:MAG: CCGSCS motif protein [Marinobacter sp.]|uniref:CCGSCS motif protein n=1 Tax=Marinobacter sp. TaxID=50741 RepID=UPI003F9A2F6C